jgi:hypothetical protein
MLLSLLLIGYLFPGVGPAVPESPPAAILGQWESAVRNKGGIGNILEFAADGRVTQISAAMGDAAYGVEGEWLRIYWTDEASGKVSESDTLLEFRGSEVFVEKGEDGVEQSYSERVGSPPLRGASPVVGQWCSLLLDTLTSFREFTADGKMFVRLPTVILRGRYSVAGDTLTVQIDGQPPGQYPFRFENGQLVIKNRDGSDRPYRRTACTLLKGY